MSISDLQSVVTYRGLIEAHLERLVASRKNVSIEPPITEGECVDLIENMQALHSGIIPDEVQAHFGAVETVFREKFMKLLASTHINEPEFSQVWILLDLITVLSDKELCEPGLGFWLIEELLDSQTIEGCRKVFDYLESRRERITAKHFKHKSLVILRCCNELLRRLSRAEDTVFCGRVFIFLFQSFPLGDKSSVNLRGEFHVENVTTFDPAPKKSEDAIKPMEIDADVTLVPSGNQTPASSVADLENSQKLARSAGPSSKPAKTEEPPDLDALYPMFWSLQSIFSSPTRLFDPANMASFKEGIAATLSCFQKMTSTSSSSTRPEETKRGTKRKRSETLTGTSSAFNPKYLTNRDLFDLEVHDIAFRRHILVQALILIDFLLSLTPAAKAKLADLSNKSVLYAYALSDEDAKWTSATRASIAAYLQQGNGNEGKFYYRMVDTVLSRDKNWVRWKAENCPSISRPPVDAKTHVEAQKNLQKLCSKNQPLPLPPGAADLEFLSKNESFETLKGAIRNKVPSMDEFYHGIINDELDAEMGTEEEKTVAREAMQGKIWRALRASGRRFYLCEAMANGKNLKALLGNKKGGDEGDGAENTEEDGAGGAAMTVSRSRSLAPTERSSDR